MPEKFIDRGEDRVKARELALQEIESKPKVWPWGIELVAILRREDAQALGLRMQLSLPGGVSPLLDKASSALQSQEAARIKQEQADAISAETRLIAEELLKAHGLVKRNMNGRVMVGIFSVIPGMVLGLALNEFVVWCSEGRHLWEMEDERIWSTTINTGGQPVNVEFLSDHINPSKANKIRVGVEGIKNRLVLYPSSGVYDSNRKPVGLEDAKKWHQLIVGLQEQPLSSPPSLPDPNRVKLRISGVVGS